MGKLSDVIRHAGELSEETDDEDLWEEGEAEEYTAEQPEGFDAEEYMAEQPEKFDVENTEEEEISGGEAYSLEEAGMPGKDASGSEEAGMSGGDDFRPEESAEPECNEEGIPIKDILYAESIRRRGKDQILVHSVYDRKMITDMLFRHAYLSTGGYCGLLISFCAIGAAIYTYGRIQTWISFVLLLAGCMFVVIEPFLLRDRAKQMTRKGGIYYMPILFVLTPYGIELTRNGNHASHEWSDVTRVTTTKYAVVLYKGKHTALVLTKKGIGDQKEHLYAMIRQRASNAKYMKLK